MTSVLAIIMAGGAGTRLSVLSDERSKPAVPFAGRYRIIDFTLSNCVNSGIYQIDVLTQYRPHSLNRHIGIGKPWDLDRARGGVRLLQPYQGRGGSSWYTGTADAVLQNLEDVRAAEPQNVLILSGDHIYKMDYGPMLRFHQESNADLTVAVMQVPLAETDRFGIMQTDADRRISDFFEKPAARDKGTLASMGIYVFKPDVLYARLADSAKRHANLDFGKHVIPEMISGGRCFAYAFDGYWVDVGTLQSYWETNLALLAPDAALNLYDPDWVIHTLSQERPPVKIGLQGHVSQSMVCNGCVVRGTVEHSVLSPGVQVMPGALVRDSIVMNDAWIGPDAVLERAIVDKNVVVGHRVRLGTGDDNSPNVLQPDKLYSGLTVVGKGALIPPDSTIGRNVIIQTGAQPPAFAHFGRSVPSGATVQ